MRKSWVDMTREELITEKGSWESRLQQTNLTLKTANRVAASTGKFMPVAEYAALEAERLRLASGLRGLQAELSKRTAEEKFERRWESCFADAAEELLSEAEYNRIAGRADLLSGGSR